MKLIIIIIIKIEKNIFVQKKKFGKGYCPKHIVGKKGIVLQYRNLYCSEEPRRGWIVLQPKGVVLQDVLQEGCRRKFVSQYKIVLRQEGKAAGQRAGRAGGRWAARRARRWALG